MMGEIWYSATEKYGPENEKKSGWEKYQTWSKLYHLSELVSLDGSLNGLLFEPEVDSEEYWKYVVTEEHITTQFFTSIDYVLKRISGADKFNLLALVKEPGKTIQDLTANFSFIGYDLIETDGHISALVNCGGFDKSFLPEDLNQFGLVSNWGRAKNIQQSLLLNYPEEDHADCYLYEVWRHKVIGTEL